MRAMEAEAARNLLAGVWRVERSYWEDEQGNRIEKDVFGTVRYDIASDGRFRIRAEVSWPGITIEYRGTVEIRSAEEDNGTLHGRIEHHLHTSNKVLAGSVQEREWALSPDGRTLTLKSAIPQQVKGIAGLVKIQLSLHRKTD